jgi:dTDP-4-amino-4,6-dideoxygalactose transaminase
MGVRRQRQYGWDEHRQSRDIGVNSRLDEIQAAILSAKLPGLDTDNGRRSRLAKRYADGLSSLPVTVPKARPEAGHVFHLYVIACDHRIDLKSHICGNWIRYSLSTPGPSPSRLCTTRAFGRETCSNRLAGSAYSKLAHVS